MKFQWNSLTSKTLFVIGIVLCFEVGFVSGLLSLVHEQERLAVQEERAKAIVANINLIVENFYQITSASRDYMRRGRGEQALLRYMDARQKVPPAIMDLKRRLTGSGADYARVLSLEAKANALDGILMESYREDESIALKDSIESDLMALMLSQKRVTDASSAHQENSLRQKKILLTVGLAGNIILVFGMALFLVGNVTRRLQILVRNAHRVPRNQTLEPPISGGDEIARLDRVFHDMVDSINESARRKQEFVQMISHDLRTPLMSVRGFFQLLNAGKYGEGLTDRGKERGALAERNIERLIKLINELLDIEKMESGKMAMNFGPVALADVVQRSVDAVRVMGEQAKIAVAVDLPSLNYELNADGDRLVQVIVNLVSNSIKFSPPGSTIRVFGVSGGDSVELRIADEGRGIPASQLDSVFDRFKQVKADEDRKKGGSGLGLAICKAIIESHEGTIGVESEEGKGSTFWFRIPFTPPQTAEHSIRSGSIHA
jgi:signal transduction histidine kinase